MRLIDSHAHLQAHPFDGDRSQVVEAAFRAGVAKGPSRLLARDAAMTLSPLTDTSVLDDLVSWYLQGASLPLPFFPESSLAFAEALRQGKSEDDATGRARQKWRPRERAWAEADEPSIRQLFGDTDPLHARFRELALSIYGPLLDSEVWE